MSDNSLNRSYQDMGEAETTPTGYEIKTPTNYELRSPANRFFKSPIAKGSKLLLESPDGRSDSQQTFGDINEWNR